MLLALFWQLYYYQLLFVIIISNIVYSIYIAAVWHQFDGVVYPDFRESSSTWYDPRTWGSGWKSKFDHAKVVKDREYAAISFLPMWDGFVSGDQIEQMTALEAIDRIKHLQECLSNPWISVSNYPIKKYVSLKDFPFKKVMYGL